MHGEQSLKIGPFDHKSECSYILVWSLLIG